MEKKNYIIIGVLGLLIGLYFLLRSMGVFNVITLDTVKLYREALKNFVDSHVFIAPFIYLGTYTIAVGACLPAAGVLSILGGFLFGPFKGIILILIGATSGATISFLVSRYILGDRLQRMYGNRLETFNREIEDHGANYLLMIRLIPLFPFFISNVLAGLTVINLYTFVWTTAIGIIPVSLIFALAGDKLMHIQHASEIISWPIIILKCVLSASALIPVFLKRYRYVKSV